MRTPSYIKQIPNPVFQDIHKAQNMEEVDLNKDLSNDRGLLGLYFGFVCLFFSFTLEGYKYLSHSRHLGNPKDKCTVLSLHHSSLHFYSHRHEDSLAHRIQGDTLKNESIK